MKNQDLSIQEWQFVAEYMIDAKPGEAIKRAGYVGDFAREEGARLLRLARVRREIDKIQKECQARLQLNTNVVISDILNVLTADPRELYNIRHAACRYCYGEDHLYQRTIGEYRRDEFEANAKVKWFDPQGGPGFNPTKDPHPDCPECFGKGELVEEIKDLRELTPEQVALYVGGERTRNGLKLVMRSKDAAREAAARYLGMNKETVNVTHKLSEKSDEELERIARGEA